MVASEAGAQGCVRVGIGAAVAAETKFVDVNCESASPAALYGCGHGDDGAPLRTVGEFGATGVLELGAGYALGPATHVELALEYRLAAPFAGRANFLAPEREQSVTAERLSSSAMIAVQREWPMAPVRGFSGFHPFAGVGIGRARHCVGELRMSFPATETFVPGGAVSARTFAVTAGITRRLGEGTALELAWRYTEQGDIETGEGRGRVQWRDGSRTISLDLASTRARARQNAFRLSIRHM